MTASSATGRCVSCVHFRNDPAYLETAFKGLTALSSAAGTTRGDDGICLLHDRYLSVRASCAAFTPVSAVETSVFDATPTANAARAIERVAME